MVTLRLHRLPAEGEEPSVVLRSEHHQTLFPRHGPDAGPGRGGALGQGPLGHARIEQTEEPLEPTRERVERDGQINRARW